MSDDNVQKNDENDISPPNAPDQQKTTPQSSPASSTSSLERSNSTDGGALLDHCIIEVSDDNKDADEVEEEIQLHRSHMPLRRAHNFLMACGHPAPPADRNRIKKWVSNGRNWCPACNPLITRNLICGTNMLSGWRKTMEQLIEKNVFPLSVLNLNDTYVYSGNNNQETSLLPPTPSSPPFMLDLDVFLGIVCANDLCRLPLRALSCLRSFIHSDTRVIPFFEKIHPQSLQHFSVNLLETAIRLMEEPTEQSEMAFRRSKTALQCFYQAAVRVPFFRETIYKHQLSQWLNLLRIEFLRNDIILSLLMVIKEMHHWFFHADDLYTRLLSDLLLLFGSHTSGTEHKSFIISIFTVLFNTDPSFLYDSYRLMDRESFSELLSVLETALTFTPIYRLRDVEFNIPPKVCLHPLNLAFCLELIEHIDRELSEFRALKFDVGGRLVNLVHIVNICSSARDVYNEVLHKGNAISLISGIFKALMFAQKEYVTFVQRAQHLMNNNAQRAVGTNPANAAKFRYEAQQQRNALKSRPIRERVQLVNEKNIQQKRMIKNVSIDFENTNGSDHPPSEKMQLDNEQKVIQDMRITSTDQFQQKFGSKTQHAFDNKKEEWQLEKEVELPVDIQDSNNENGDEPRKKHARMHSGSESSESPIDGNPVDDQMESIQVDDSAELEEIKPLLSASDVSSSSSGDEAAPLTNQRPTRPPMAKVTPLLNNPANINISGKSNNCYEEMDEEEEESDLDDSGSQNGENIFGPRSEILFSEYMAEKTPDFDPNSLNEDELLIGLPCFRSLQPVYQMLVTRNITQQLFANLKLSTLKAIDSLCKHSEKNRLIAGRLDAIPLIIQFCTRQEGERALMLAILALRSLCLDCFENQERLLEITEGCSHFIDRQRLFFTMGVELDLDKSGRQILVPLDKE